jgi:predicted transglutaminase-like cysteine proteinase
MAIAPSARGWHRCFRRLPAPLRVVIAALPLALPAAHAVNAAVAPGNAAASFLGTVETRFNDVRPLTAWRSVLDRASREADAAAAGDCPAPSRGCPYQSWVAFIEDIRGLSRRRQLQRVNDYLNRQRYIADSANYAVQDFWASPGEFLLRGGDCEDYAIAKYFSLKRLGWSDQDLRLVLVMDTALAQSHAVLVARHRGRIWLLDNRVGRVIDIEEADHYQPMFSVNATTWWRHYKTACAERC